jgi:hypothetical protein
MFKKGMKKPKLSIFKKTFNNEDKVIKDNDKPIYQIEKNNIKLVRFINSSVIYKNSYWMV